MLFNSYEFFFFFPIVTIIYFLLPQKYRWFHLLAASCVFYCAFIPIYILILFFTILIDYCAGIFIEKSSGQKRKCLLILSLVANIGVLAVFKYYNFLSGNFNAICHLFHLQYNIELLKIILPIGLSFHTFQAMSYTIEVYRGNQKAERHLGIYALYVMFYPQLVAGPIERPQNLLWQFRQKFDFEYGRVTSGLKLMAWGLFKKVVIADRLAVVANQVFGDPYQYDGFPLVIGVVFFSLQIYCDFSGYSDIAIGAARVMGFSLMKNFDRPYSAKTISEFWKRWHISLSTWFRDYLYISIGGNRVSTARRYFNLFFVFTVSGLLHGASWNFVIWGALHGFYLIVGIVTKPIRASFNRITKLSKFPSLLHGIDVTIVCLLVAFAWIFFRAANFADATYIINHLFTIHSFDLKGLLAYINIPVLEAFYPSGLESKVALVSVLIMEAVQYLHQQQAISLRLSEIPFAFRFNLYFLLMMSIILFGMFGKTQFIYFQF
ncbi:MAG: MBOAT family protein [Bacteroidetes bacterium]|nr:MBOAT family protein [Bacteroidota bacterium]